MSAHAAGLLGLVLIFVIGTLRPVNLGILALGATYLVGALAGGKAQDSFAGFPVDLLVLLAGVTYLFAIADRNGTVERVVLGVAGWVEGRRALIPWAVFVLAALPAMAGALGSAGVALLAPLALRLAERCDIDRRMIGLMVVHGAGAGNFSPLNVLGAIVQQAASRGGVAVSATGLFFAGLVFNVALAAVAFCLLGGLRPRGKAAAAPVAAAVLPGFGAAQISTLLALLIVAVVSLGFGQNIGFVALLAGVSLQLLFPESSKGAEKRIAWDVVLLVCGIVTYVAALQRFGTVTAVGTALAGIGSARAAAFLVCAVGAVTSAFASSAAILGAMVPLATPLILRGELDSTGVVVALSICATVVDAAPFSTVGALVVANASDAERAGVYRGLLLWGAAMVVSAPPLTWLFFIR